VTPIDDIPGIVGAVRAGFRNGLLSDVQSRRVQLQQLRALLVDNEDAIAAALTADFGKPPIETYGTEIGFTVKEIDHALKQVDTWVKPRKAKLPIMLRPGSAQIVPEPLGVVLVIAPWNYPIQLQFGPLVGALAAGNAAILKPSELTAAASALIASLVPEYLDDRVVRVVEGGPAETEALLEQRFDHIVYTGNGRIARTVMAAAAKHLTPVTLELGGKSPAIVLADADIDAAARRIVWGKFLNAGQTCVAPDYVLVDSTIEDRFLGSALRAVHDFYGDEPRTSPDFARIVNDRHFQRVTGLLDAGGHEAIVTGGTRDAATRYIAPTVVAGVDPSSALMAEEIFGPVLPVLSIQSADEAISFVNDRDKPLALYVFGSDDVVLQRVIDSTSSGGVTVNHTVLHVAAPELPFGGVGASGMGAYHGKWGFDAFTHLKPVLTKPARPDPPVLYPPYKAWKQKLMRKVM
jgi:aldehyde dehydrogenase (NAD+)